MNLLKFNPQVLKSVKVENKKFQGVFICNLHDLEQWKNLEALEIVPMVPADANEDYFLAMDDFKVTLSSARNYEITSLAKKFQNKQPRRDVFRMITCTTLVPENLAVFRNILFVDPFLMSLKGTEMKRINGKSRLLTSLVKPTSFLSTIPSAVRFSNPAIANTCTKINEELRITKDRIRLICCPDQTEYLQWMITKKYSGRTEAFVEVPKSNRKDSQLDQDKIRSLKKVKESFNLINQLREDRRPRFYDCQACLYTFAMFLKPRDLVEMLLEQWSQHGMEIAYPNVEWMVQDNLEMYPFTVGFAGNTSKGKNLNDAVKRVQLKK
ncbi:hypothetical protein B9Z55_022662 [Caenorhabditis nigoni]|uniref:DUF38 domain-containing protein n=1 Tax=Caenorhabditis nigoni TaxID=1611254 RepID=A0A2G5SLP2_9PELO|nr:hypothetical protein B9Z55_022662 [Caenorhabditis nigoni]